MSTSSGNDVFGKAPDLLGDLNDTANGSFADFAQAGAGMYAYMGARIAPTLSTVFTLDTSDPYLSCIAASPNGDFGDFANFQQGSAIQR